MIMKEFISILKDLWLYMKETKKYYLSLLIILMLMMGALIVLTEGSAVMPFVYTLF